MKELYILVNIFSGTKQNFNIFVLMFDLYDNPLYTYIPHISKKKLLSLVVTSSLKEFFFLKLLPFIAAHLSIKPQNFIDLVLPVCALTQNAMLTMINCKR